MSAFKLAKKDALSYTRTTIYDLYEKKLDYFESEKNRKEEYVQTLKELQNSYLNSSNDDKYQISKKIDDLETKIQNIENDYELNEYLLEFYAIINKQENEYESISQKGQMDSFIQSTVNNSKTEIYNEYIKIFNPELKEIEINGSLETYCKKCKNTSFTFELKSSSNICTECGLSTTLILQDETGYVYTENVEQVIVFNYKRNNHFQECLNQLQAKENTTIPSQIIKDLNFEFRKYNIINPKLFTAPLIKSYLKKLKYNKYYEHIPTIINEFCGLPAPKLTPELEQQLRIMFDEIQGPFEKYRKIICPARKNFLNYNYIFFKMCQLLNKDEFLNFFPLLKSREKLYEHDLIWKGICKDLRWEYIPSI
jgi:hypothetical protein